jgi:ATP synthase F1 epsilon subunit
MKLTILSFDGKKIENNNVVSITLMTKLGEITVLDKHEPLIASIKPSTMYYVYIDENNIKQRDDVAIWNWVVEVSNSIVKVMIDMLIDIEDLDVTHLERAKIDAQKKMEALKHSKDKIDMEKFIEAEDALLKSIAWLKLYDIKR